jgi:hypothetical protein
MSISEREFLIPALQLAASTPGGEIKTSKVLTMLEEIFQPVGSDAQILDGRSDTKFSQKVRNLISHRQNRTSMFRRGFAELIDGGFRITSVGRRFLQDEGH